MNDETEDVAPSLDALVEIRLPEPISNAPATPAWTVLFVALALLLAIAIWLVARWWRRNAYRREALRYVDTIEQDGRAWELPVLVKRVALEAWPRKRVAGLTGDGWLAFLDESYGGTGFTQGAGRVLPDLAYGDRKTEASPALLQVVRTWIRKHRA